MITSNGIVRKVGILELHSAKMEPRTIKTCYSILPVVFDIPPSRHRTVERAPRIHPAGHCQFANGLLFPTVAVTKGSTVSGVLSASTAAATAAIAVTAAAVAATAAAAPGQVPVMAWRGERIRWRCPVAP